MQATRDLRSAGSPALAVRKALSPFELIIREVIAFVVAVAINTKRVVSAPFVFFGALILFYVSFPLNPMLAPGPMRGMHRARDALGSNAGLAATPFVAIITSVLVIVIGIELISTVVTNVDSAMTLATSGSSFPLAGIVLPFIPVVYIAAIMGISGAIGYAGTMSAGQDRFTNLILTVLVVVIGIALTTTVITSSGTALTAINAATNTMTLAATIMPFLPVVYVAAILGLASMTGFRAWRAG